MRDNQRTPKTHGWSAASGIGIAIHRKKERTGFVVLENGRLTVRSQIGDTTNGIALDFDVRAQHLSNKWLQASQFDDEKLIVG